MRKNNVLHISFKWQKNGMFIVLLCLLTCYTSALKAKTESLTSPQKIDKDTKTNTLDEKAPPLKTNNAFMFGVGTASLYDTYLSPLAYTGISVNLYSEKMRRTTWFGYRFYKQQIIQLELSLGQNPPQNGYEYNARFYYRLGGHYRFYETSKVMLGIGGIWDVTMGGIYNDHNGNNPASARAYSNMNLSVIASYKFSWGALRWQIDTPLFGVALSPEFGESYYEIGQEGFTKLINFAFITNQRVLRNYLTIDIPIHTRTLRIGYLGYYYQTKFEQKQTHNYTNNFVIGFPIDGVKKPRKKANNNFWGEENN